MKDYTGETFLNKIYKNLVNSDIVKHTAIGRNKNEDVRLYMDRLERVTKKSVETNNLELLKSMYYKKYVIKPEKITDEYFETQEIQALNQGYGHLKYTNELKEQEKQQIISEQKESLSRWIDYFASEDTNQYPTWFKYYVFQSVVKMGYFDKSKNEFTKRTNKTIKPFIEINYEALAMVYDELVKVLKKEHIDDNVLEQLINNGSFPKIYAYCINKLDSIKKDTIKSNDGIWKKYIQGSDPNILFNEIHGKGTGWCTAGGIETATDHLNGGDFYVYFTKDQNNEYTQPRIAIRTNNGALAEIRGIEKNQNLEPEMEDVVEKKLQEFSDRDLFKKKVSDMRELTRIYNKHSNNEELTKEELIFLYEVDDKIVGFGYEKDPRIKEIIGTRYIRKDLAFILSCKEENISLNKKEALSGNIVFHYGNLDLSSLTRTEGLVLPKEIGGSLNLSGLTSAEGLVLPEEIGGFLYLDGLTSAEGLVLPKKIGDHLNLSSLTRTEGLVLPEEIGGYLDLSGLTSAEGLILPKEIGGSLNLSGLTSAEGLVLPEEIGGYLSLSRLISAEGLVLPKKISYSLNLSGLRSVEGLVLPEEIGGNLNLSELISAKDLVLPKKIGGELNLSKLTNFNFADLLRNTKFDFDDFCLFECHDNGNLVNEDKNLFSLALQDGKYYCDKKALMNLGPININIGKHK